MADVPLISGVRARAVNVPLARPLGTSSGTVATAPLVLIDVATGDGPAGSAYLFVYTPKALRAVVALIDEMLPLLEGRPLAPRDRSRELMAAFVLLGRPGLVGTAISGLDMALWDGLARLHGVSVCRLLGGSERPIPTYATLGVVDPNRDLGAVTAALDDGLRGVKIMIGVGDLDTDVATVAAVRREIGPKVALMVDYNQSLSVPEAVRRIRRLEEFDLLWVEEPVPAADLAGHAAVRAAVRTPVQTGENWWFPEDVARAVRAGASDFAMLDLARIGGISGWLRAAPQAEGASLPVSSHLFAEASAHALAVTPGAQLLEYVDLAGGVLQERLRPVDGEVTPRGPGLGLAWDEAAVARWAA